MELGCTGPSERREAAKSGSRASRDTAMLKGTVQLFGEHSRQQEVRLPGAFHVHSSLLSLAEGGGCTVGPGAALSVFAGAVADGLVAFGVGGMRDGYFRRVAVLPAVLAAFEEEEPIFELRLMGIVRTFEFQHSDHVV